MKWEKGGYNGPPGPSAKEIPVGTRYARLEVISFSESTGSGALWECRCDCGNTCQVLGTHLRTGRRKSCGKCKEMKLLYAVREAGVPPCEFSRRKCTAFRHCATQKQACSKFYDWVHFGGKVHPDLDKCKPNGQIYRRLFPNEKTESIGV